MFDLNDIDSIEECKKAVKRIVQVIASGKVPYRSPVFRVLGLIASTAEEREAFLDKIADQIDSIATDVSSIDSTLTFADLDEINSIKDAVNSLQNGQDELAKTLDEILSKLE